MRTRRVSALLALALLLSGPAMARRATKTPPPPEEEESAMPTLEDRQAVFGDIDEAFKRGEKTRVADLLIAVTQNPDDAVFHAEAYARLAAMLDQLDLPYASLVAYEKALATDAVAVSSVARDAIRVGDEVGDLPLLGRVFAANVGLDVDPATRSRMAYLAAREAHHQGKTGTAIAILKMVKDDDPYYPEAKSLEGVLLSVQGRHKKALAPLLTAQQAGLQAQRGQRFQDVLNLNIARAYFGAENFPRAIEYYAQVGRGSNYWPEAEFERAWAHFRMQDMNGTLALLQNHVGPYFADWYFPEGSLLRVYALFLMCKFPEASKQIDQFRDVYTPKAAELDQLASMSPQQLWDDMVLHVDPPRKSTAHSSLPHMITFKFENDDRFLDSLTAVKHADDEIARLKNVSSHPFSEPATRWVQQRRDAIMRAEGQRIHDRVVDMQAQLQQMLADIEMSKLDMMQFETRLYQHAAAEGADPEARRVVTRQLRVKPDQRWWPWEGEYWADEIGYYRFVARPECPLGLTPSGDKAEQ